MVFFLRLQGSALRCAPPIHPEIGVARRRGLHWFQTNRGRFVPSGLNRPERIPASQRRVFRQPLNRCIYQWHVASAWVCCVGFCGQVWGQVCGQVWRMFVGFWGQVWRNPFVAAGLATVWAPLVGIIGGQPFWAKFDSFCFHDCVDVAVEIYLTAHLGFVCTHFGVRSGIRTELQV